MLSTKVKATSTLISSFFAVRVIVVPLLFECSKQILATVILFEADLFSLIHIEKTNCHFKINQSFVGW